MKNQFKAKVGWSALAQTEEKHKELLDSIIANLNRRLVSKKEYGKSMGELDKKVRELSDVLNGQLNSQDVSDAMLSKKKIGSVSCMSCQKDIVNLES